MDNTRIQRWAIILGKFNCKIEYISGPKNVVVDLLSRMHNTTPAGNIDDNEHLDWKAKLQIYMGVTLYSFDVAFETPM